MTTPDDKKRVLCPDDPIPDDLTTEEAAAFWDTHTPGPERLMAAGKDPETAELMAKLRGGQRQQPRQAKATFVTSLRLDEDMEKRLKNLARLKQVPYQTLLKQFVGERLYEEEKRLGVI